MLTNVELYQRYNKCEEYRGILLKYEDEEYKARISQYNKCEEYRGILLKYEDEEYKARISQEISTNAF